MDKQIALTGIDHRLDGVGQQVSRLFKHPHGVVDLSSLAKGSRAIQKWIQNGVHVYLEQMANYHHVIILRLFVVRRICRKR